MIENGEYDYPEDLQRIDAFLYGKCGRDALLARKIIEHKQRYMETGNADWLIHAARVVAGFSDGARAKLACAGVIVSGKLELDSLRYHYDRNGHTLPPCITPENARLLGVELKVTHYLHKRN